MQRMGPGVADWHDFLSDADRATIERGKWARRGGFGVRPALIVIDAQNYMVGEEGRAGRPEIPAQLRRCRLGRLGAY